MKREVILSLSIAALTLPFCLPKDARALSATDASASPSTAQSTAKSLAARMVPALAKLDRNLDAKKMQSGEQFEAALQEKADLKNGTELPRGTTLIGTVVADNMHAGGNSRLTLRFTQAKLKDGKMIPIKAMIVGISPPASQYGQDQYAWSTNALQIDDIGAVSGADLHSNVVSNNSGVFVSPKKGDVKLMQDSAIALKIMAAQRS